MYLHGSRYGKILIVLVFGCSMLLPAGVTAKEYLLTGSRPNKLYLIDVPARNIEREIEIPEPGIPWVIIPGPNGKYAYVVTDRQSAISAMDLDSGKERYRIRPSQQNTRVKIMTLTLSRDGTELFVYETPVEMLKDDYKVQDNRISVYAATGPNQGQLVRTLPAPRRIVNMVMSADDQSLYALNWDLLRINPVNGEILETYPLMNWEREQYYPPDIFYPFYDYEQADVFASTLWAVRSDIDPAEFAAYETHILTVDLKSGAIGTSMFENSGDVIFNIVVSPTEPVAFAGYTTLAKIDLEQSRTVKRIELDHTYYLSNVTGDGKEVVVGGGMCDIAIYSAEDLSKTGQIELPGCPDMVFASLRFIQR